MTADYQLLEELPTLDPFVSLNILSVDRMIETYALFKDAAWNNEKLLQSGQVTREMPINDVRAFLHYVGSVKNGFNSVKKIKFPFPYQIFRQEERNEVLRRVASGAYETKTFEVNGLFAMHYVYDAAEKVFDLARKFENAAGIYKTYLAWRLTKTDDKLKEIDEMILKSKNITIPDMSLSIPGISTKEHFRTDYDMTTDIVKVTVDSPYHKFSVSINVHQGIVQPVRPRTVDFLASETVQGLVFTNPTPQLIEMQKKPEEYPLTHQVSYGHEMSSRDEI